MEGNNINIAIKGIARQGGNQSCDDGLCNEMIGLEIKDGIYVPCSLDKATIVFNETDIVNAWIHKTTRQQNIIVKKEDNSFYWCAKDNTDELTYIDTYGESSVVNISNNAIAIDNDFLLFSNGKYQKITLSDVDFSMQLDVRRNGIAMLHKVCQKKFQKDIKDKDDTWTGTWVKQSLNQLASDVKDKEYLVGMAYMRYAFRLFDGTYINASSPVLVSDTMFSELGDFDTKFDDTPNSKKFYKDNTTSGYSSVVRYIGYLANMGWKFRETEMLDKLIEDNKEYQDKKVFEENCMFTDDTYLREDIKINTSNTIEKSDGVYVRYSEFDLDEFKKKKYIRIDENYNGKSSDVLSKIVTIPNTINSKKVKNGNVWNTAQASGNENWFNHNVGWQKCKYDFKIPGEYCYRSNRLGLYYDEDGKQTNANKGDFQLFASRNLATPIFRIVRNLNSEYKDIISSVDIFMTRPVSMFEDKMDYGASGIESNMRKFKGKSVIKKELYDSLTSFYKIHEIKFEDIIKLNTETVYVPYIERGCISSIEQQQVLNVNSPHIDKYETSFVYNNKLHIANLKTKLYRPYNSDSLSICDTNQGEPRLYPKLTIGASIILKENNSLYRISNTFKTNRLFNGFFNGNFIYPDDRAIYLSIDYIKDESGSYLKKRPFGFNLESHNGYAVNTNLGLINIQNALYLDYKLIPCTNLEDRTLERNGNIFKVSMSNNIIQFPLLQTYQVGFGKIIGFASSTRALSQGQFGQYPLYVFTSEGIYVMEVDTSGLGAYKACLPISREVCNNKNSIVQIDGMVIFSTNKGLMILSGTDVVPFSEHINGRTFILPKDTEVFGDGLGAYNKAIENKKLVTLKKSLTREDFVDYISNKDTKLGYIYNKNKILVYNKGINYAYLIDIQSKITTKLSNKILFDDNNYPEESYAEINDGKIYMKTLPYRLSDKYTQTFFQTRPIKLGTYDFKSSFRIVLRGYFEVEPEKYAGIYVIGSNDTVQWMYIGGTAQSGIIHDLGAILERVSCKYLMVIYVGSISSNSYISGLEISTEVKYNNKLK